MKFRVNLDETSARMYELIIRENVLINERIKNVLFETHELASQCDYGETELKDDKALAYLNLRIGLLLNKISKICSKYGQLEFLSLFRRIRTKMLFNRWDQQISGLNVQRLCILSILKYCRTISRRIKWYEVDGDMVSYIESDVEILADLFSLLRLTEELNLMLNLRRIIWKGGTLNVGREMPSVSIDPHLRKMIQLYDSRLSLERRSIYSMTGLGIKSLVEESFNGNLSILCCFPCIEDCEEFSVSIKNIEYQFPRRNYNSGSFSLIRFSEILSLYKDDFEKNSLFTIKEIITFLISVSRRLLIGLSNNPISSINMITQRGLLYFLYDEFIEDLTEIFPIEYSRLYTEEYKGDSEVTIRELLSEFILSDEEKKKINLEFFSPSKALYKIEKSIAIDLVQILQTVVDFLRDIKISNPTRQVKGETYEQDLLSYIISKSEELKTLFPPRKKLRKNGQNYAEIDLSFFIEEFGFLIECKAYTMTRECQWGFKRDMENRWSTVEEWICEIINKTNKVAESPIGDNYKLPEEVKYLIPVVCSSNVEFLFECNSMLTSDIPMVCTPVELADYLQLFDPEHIYSKTLIIPVK